MLTLVPLLALLIATYVASPAHGILGVGSTQTLTVQGQLLCNGRPASNVLVKLYAAGVIWDSKMASTRSDQNGNFVVSGSHAQLTTVSPKFNIYHTCDETTFQVCPWKTSYVIPEQYIDSTFNVGTIELANRPKGTSTDCIH